MKKTSKKEGKPYLVQEEQIYTMLPEVMKGNEEILVTYKTGGKKLKQQSQ